MRICTSLVASLLIIATTGLTASAVNVYWDIDAAENGSAGGVTPAGTWDGAATNWNNDPLDGAGALKAAWVAGDNAVFSAAGDATGSFDVTVSGTQVLNSLTVEEGTIRQLTGTIDFGAVNGVFTIASGATWNNAGAGTGTITGTGGITKTGAGTLLLGGANTFTKVGGPVLSITGGVADFTADLGLGSAPAAATATAVSINGGTLRATLGTSTVALNANRGINIGASGGTIEVNSTAISGLQTANAGNNLNGSGTLTKTGNGRLTITPSSTTFTGKYNVLAGALNFASDLRLGPVPATTANYFTLNGANAGLRFSVTTAQTLNAARGITLGAGGGTLIEPGPGVMTYNGIIAGTSGGALRVSWNDNLDGTGNGGGAAGGTVILGGANTYDGGTAIGAGTTLKLGAAGVIPDTSVVTPSGAAAFFDTGNFSETVKSISGTAGTIAVGTGTLTLNNPAGETYSSVFTGTAGGKVIKNGTGTLILGGGSSTGYSGEWVLNNGVIGVGGNNNFGSNALGPVLTINGGKLANTAGTGRTMSANLSVNLSGDFTVDDTLFANPGVISFGGTNTIRNSNRTITVNNGTVTLLTFSTGIGEDVAGRSLTKAGNGIMTLGGNNTYTGDTFVNAGTLISTATTSTYAGDWRVAPGAKLQVNGAGLLGDGTRPIHLDAATLNTSANRTAATPNPLDLITSSAITTTSTASTVDWDFSGSTFTPAVGTTLTFRNDGADAATDVFQPRFSGSGFTYTEKIAIENGSVGLTKLQSYNTTGTFQTFAGEISGTGSYVRNASTAGSGGSTTFSAANTYSGGTNVSRGTLLVTNTTGSGTGTGSVTVGTNGTLGGTGTVSGVVTLNSGGVLAPGLSIGTLVLGGLTLESGSQLNAEVAAPSTSDVAVVTTPSTGLTINAGSLVNVTDTGGIAAGTYTLIDYDTAFVGSVGNIVVNTGPAGFEYDMVDSGTSIDMVVSVSAGGDSTWKGDISGNWTPVGNWLNGSPNAIDKVATLGSVITAQRTVTLNGGKTVATLNFNDTDGYIVAGSTLTMSKTSGNAAINVVNGSHTISAPVALATTTDVTVTNLADTLSMSEIISGTGTALNKLGSGTLALSGNNTYDGGTTITTGKLLVNNTTGSGTGSGAVTVASGATLGGTGSIGGAITNNGILSPGTSGVGTLSTTGNFLDAAGSIWNIDLSLTGNDMLAVTGDIDLTAADTLNVLGTGTGTSWIIGTYTGTETGVFDTITSGYAVTYIGGNITLNAAPACAPGDANCDGSFNAQDFVLIRKTYSDITSGTGLTEYTAWRAAFTGTPGSGSGGGLAGGTVPEPSAIVLLAIGLFAAAVRRRG